MKKSLLNIKGSKTLDKNAQKAITGGFPVIVSDCPPAGCYSYFFCPNDGSPVCAIPSPSGATCIGTHINGQCCV